MDELEKELFKIIHRKEYKVVEGMKPISAKEINQAKAAAALCREKMKEAWEKGYKSGRSTYPELSKNPYS